MSDHVRIHCRTRAPNRLALLFLLSVTAAAIAAPPAAATDPETWHAAPNGMGSECTEANPCPLEFAVETKAQEGDTVTAAAGTYEMRDEDEDQALTVEGLTLEGAGAGETVIRSSAHVSVAAFSSTVRDLTIENLRPAGMEAFVLSAEGGTVERVVARSANDSGGPTCSSTSQLVRDTACIGGRTGLELRGFDSKLVNVTATGSNVGIQVFAFDRSTGSNVIASGGNVDVTGNFEGGLDLDHSNYDSVDPADVFTPPGTNGNQTAPPVFAADGYHQAPTSPTVDAGDSFTADLGLFDLDGESRVQGASVDIGADELTVVPEPEISIDDVTVTERDSESTDATFTVSLSEASTEPVEVDFATADGTASAPDDYSATSGTLSIVPGATSEQISVPVKGDLIDETDEVFTLELSNPSGATIADGEGTGTILDDDEELDQLSADVEALELAHGTERSLLAKLADAQAAIDAGETDEACDSLGAFINEIRAQRGKKISVAEADRLIGSTEALRGSLGCT